VYGTNDSSAREKFENAKSNGGIGTKTLTIKPLNCNIFYFKLTAIFTDSNFET
jgi:hypothetical protein